jgi:actin-related protein
VAQLLQSTPVRNALHRQKLAVMLSGGATMMEGFASLLTERFIEHEIAERIQSIRLAPDPATAVVRGALIFGELEARALAVEEAA